MCHISENVVVIHILLLQRQSVPKRKTDKWSSYWKRNKHRSPKESSHWEKMYEQTLDTEHFKCLPWSVWNLMRKSEFIFPQLIQTLVPSDPHDTSNVLLEVVTGRTTGGESVNCNYSMNSIGHGQRLSITLLVLMIMYVPSLVHMFGSRWHLSTVHQRDVWHVPRPCQPQELGLWDLQLHTCWIW